MDDLRFYVLFNIFQSYQDNEKLILKAVCNGAPITVEKKIQDGSRVLGLFWKARGVDICDCAHSSSALLFVSTMTRRNLGFPQWTFGAKMTY